MMINKNLKSKLGWKKEQKEGRKHCPKIWGKQGTDLREKMNVFNPRNLYSSNIVHANNVTLYSEAENFLIR